MSLWDQTYFSEAKYRDTEPNRTEPMKRREENVNINARDSIEMGINIRESP